jgi:hypothetical protein
MSFRDTQRDGYRGASSFGSVIATAVAVVALSISSAKPASAAPVSFEGAFTYTINELCHTDDGSVIPGVTGLTVGDTFSGSYNYQSEIVDGTFGLPLGTNEGPLDLFRIFVPHPLSATLGGSFFSFLNSSVPGPIITVSGGHVSDFFWHNEIGLVGFGFDTGNFHIVKGECPDAVEGTCHARGTYNFSDPQRVPEPSTLLLFSGALAALGAGVFRSRGRKASD